MDVLILTKEQVLKIEQYIVNNYGIPYFSDNPQLAQDKDGNLIVGLEKMTSIFPNVSTFVDKKSIYAYHQIQLKQ